MNKMINVKEAIYILKKHIGLQGILCDRKVLNRLIENHSDTCYDKHGNAESDEFSELTLFGVRCKSNRLFGFTERYSDV